MNFNIISYFKKKYYHHQYRNNYVIRKALSYLESNHITRKVIYGSEQFEYCGTSKNKNNGLFRFHFLNNDNPRIVYVVPSLPEREFLKEYASEIEKIVTGSISGNCFYWDSIISSARKKEVLHRYCFKNTPSTDYVFINDKNELVNEIVLDLTK